MVNGRVWKTIEDYEAWLEAKLEAAHEELKRQLSHRLDVRHRTANSCDNGGSHDSK